MYDVHLLELSSKGVVGFFLLLLIQFNENLNNLENITSGVDCDSRIFNMQAREPNKESYNWSENQDQVLVQWSSGEAATLHILVVHAIVILLTYGRPNNITTTSDVDHKSSSGSSSSGGSCFDQLLEVWFPCDGPMPQAFLVETSEEALIHPDWLKLRMIRSSVTQLVDGALKDLEAGQLILFIQSFGIPVESISKLMEALDRMARENPFAFVEVDMDKTYMQQLLQVQWQRGARNGRHFADIMQLNVDTSAAASAGAEELDRKDALKLVAANPPLDLNHRNAAAAAEVGPLSADYCRSMLMKLFDSASVLRFSQPEKMEAFKKLNRILTEDMCSSPLENDQKKKKKSLETAAVALDQLTCSSDAVLVAMGRQPAFSCGLMRLLTSAASSAAPQSVLMQAVVKVCARIVDVLGGDAARSSQRVVDPLHSISQKFLTTTQQQQQRRTNKATRAETGDGDGESCRSLDVSLKHLEEHVQLLSRRALQTNDCRSLVSSLVDKLRQSRRGDRFVGLLVDWLELIDPEIMTVNAELQVKNTNLNFSSIFH